MVSPPVTKLQTQTSTAGLIYPGHLTGGRSGEHYQQLPKQHPPKQHFEVAAANKNRVGVATSLSLAPEKHRLTGEISATLTSSSPSISSYQSMEQTPSALDTSPTASKQLFLPPYLQPDSDVRDLSSLVDELTPIQAELGPCPFTPRDWDERRTELVRRYSAIYGQGNSKRKNEELSLHEQNINMAAFQLCLRDPTLLVRRDELLVLSRKAIKDGGYTFQHGLSKAKVAISEHLLPIPSISVVRKQPLDSMPTLDESGAGFSPGAVSGSLLPPPRNMSREKKLKRVEELEFLITKNKMKQSIKLAALEKARQANDFSMSHHLQAEIESLGSTLANLQDEYSNMKYRLRRSDRYFEKKRKVEEMMDAEMIRSAVQHRSTATTPGTGVAAKRVCTGPPEELSNERHGPVVYFSQEAGEDGHQGGKMGGGDPVHPPPPTTLSDDYLSSPHSTSGENASTNTTVSFSRSYFKVAPATTSADSAPLSSSPSSLLQTSPPSSPPPHSSPPLNNANLAYRNTKTSVTQLLSRQEEGGDSNEREKATSTSDHNKQSSKILTTEAGKDLPSSQLLADINKLATKAAANLRSMPHF